MVTIALRLVRIESREATIERNCRNTELRKPTIESRKPTIASRRATIEFHIGELEPHIPTIALYCGKKGRNYWLTALRIGLIAYSFHWICKNFHQNKVAAATLFLFTFFFLP